MSLPIFYLDERAANDFTHGRPLDSLLKEKREERKENKAPETPLRRHCVALRICVSARASSSFAAVFEETRLLGLIENQNGKWVYTYVFTDN
jgi:hypothetical protein